MRTYNFKGDIKMKKIIALLLVVVMAMTFVACGSSKNDPSAKSKGVMTYEEYAATPENQFANIEAPSRRQAVPFQSVPTGSTPCRPWCRP